MRESISAKVASSAYKSLDHFVADVESAASELLLSEAPGPAVGKGGAQWQYVPDSLDQDRLRARVASFKKLLRRIVDREKTMAKADITKSINDTKSGDASGETPNGLDPLQDDKAILTLYGNAQGHKQLFSSFQKAIPVANEVPMEIAEDALMPFREAGLPNGIQSTKVLPVKIEEASESTQARTFLDLFSPPATLPQLQPPKPSANSVRDSTLTWTHSAAEGLIPRRLGYTGEKLPTGQWLGYGGVSAVQEQSSLGAKRKQRDRALSTGEPDWRPSQGLRAAQLQAKEDALFCSVYSSFAPARDDSLAIIPQETKSNVWWHRMGGDWFEQIVHSGEPDEEIGEEGVIHNTSEILGEPLDFADEETARVVESFSHFQSSPQSAECANTLDNISEMLETLYSYHRIRNSSSTAATRSTTGANLSTHDSVGTPSTPSAAETSLYHKLVADLAGAVSDLAPYEVAKLNGDQLAELNISRRITYQTKPYTGSMEEDFYTRTAKAAALSAAPAPRATTNTNTPQYSTGYAQARTAQMTQNRATATTQQYGNATPVMPRQTSSFLRQPLSSWQSPATNYNANVQRPAYAQQSTSYTTSQRAAQNALGGRVPLNQYLQRGNNNSASTNGAYQSPSQPQYQQRAQQQQNMSGYAANPYRGASPAKPMQYTTQHQRMSMGAQAGQRPPIGAPSAGGMPQPPSLSRTTSGSQPQNPLAAQGAQQAQMAPNAAIYQQNTSQQGVAATPVQAVTAPGAGSSNAAQTGAEAESAASPAVLTKNESAEVA